MQIISEQQFIFSSNGSAQLALREFDVNFQVTSATAVIEGFDRARADAAADGRVGAARLTWVGGGLGFSFGALTTTSGSCVCAPATVAQPSATTMAQPRSR